MTKYLKREMLFGFVVSALCKLFVLGWWALVIATYVKCYDSYAASREATAPWWSWDYVPDLFSVFMTYKGVDCLAPNTVHDARTYELLMINVSQALLFRFGSLIVGVFVCRNFGKGLRDVFYPRDSRKEDKSMDMLNDELRASNPTRSDDNEEPIYGEHSDEEWDPYKEANEREEDE